jgi:membrane-associated phospholipid phosphatase
MDLQIRFRVVLSLVVVALSFPAISIAGDQIEPNAGGWRTWVISSGADYRAPAPPNPAQTEAEIRQMADLIAQNGAAEQAQIAFWDAGAPAYRWMDLINARAIAGQPLSQYAHRVYTYVALAMYDATIATWESKYHYQRRRPSDVKHNLPTAVEVPDSPSYPSEHAATAWAAATVLAYLIPAEASNFAELARQAGWSRVLAGVQYPSDVEAGKALGIAIANEVIAKAQTDGSAIPWAGVVPTGPCKWTGTNPGNAAAATWHPLLLSSPSQFRSPTPPLCTDATFINTELKTVHDFPRNVPGSFATNYKVFYWQSPEGLNTWPYRYADKWIAEDHLGRNAPRVARIYALMAATQFDAFIASQDGKFTYWYIRPHQLDTTIAPLIPVPNFPSYPSNHSTFSSSRSEILAYLFPTRADFIRAVGKEAGDSRIWGGIHYPMDNVAGNNLGKSVAQVFINWANADGSQ